jgi:hypothetical protein
MPLREVSSAYYCIIDSSLCCHAYPAHCKIRFTEKMSSNVFIKTTTKKPMKYGFYHAEGEGFLHVKNLGHGIQGTATLVRNANTGALVVRKRSKPSPMKGDPPPFADQFRLPHPHIVQLISAHNQEYENGLASSTTYWPYANDSDLHTLSRVYYDNDDDVPEIVIWQYLSQILGAYEALHRSGRSHDDGHGGNIFVHWDGTSVLPDFILGDLGFCANFPVGLTPMGAHGGQHFKVVLKDYRIDEVVGEPKLHQLLKYDAADASAELAGTDLEFFSVETALERIGDDMAKLSQTMNMLMFDEDFNDKYSEDLDEMASMIYNLQTFALSVYIRTLPRWFAFFQQVRMRAAEGLSRAIDKQTWPVRRLESFGPAPVDGCPELFNSPFELHTAGMRPPGTWYIAMVDPATLKVVAINSEAPYCKDFWYCTDASGEKMHPNSEDETMSGNPTNFGSTPHTQ